MSSISSVGAGNAYSPYSNVYNKSSLQVEGSALDSIQDYLKDKKETSIESIRSTNQEGNQPKVSEKKSESLTDAANKAMTYNSPAALKLDGFKIDNEESKASEANEQIKTKQAMDAYQENQQKQQMEVNQQKAYSVFA